MWAQGEVTISSMVWNLYSTDLLKGRQKIQKKQNCPRVAQKWEESQPVLHA